jgi:hypothetical protein
VPESTPATERVRPAGSALDVENVGAGYPLAASVMLAAVPAVTDPLAPLVMVGVVPTVKENDWVAFVPTPLLAVTVKL